MASATGVPSQAPYGEEEPLLGAPGDAQQAENERLAVNLYLGAASVVVSRDEC